MSVELSPFPVDCEDYNVYIRHAYRNEVQDLLVSLLLPELIPLIGSYLARYLDAQERRVRHGKRIEYRNGYLPPGGYIRNMKNFWKLDEDIHLVSEGELCFFEGPSKYPYPFFCTSISHPKFDGIDADELGLSRILAWVIDGAHLVVVGLENRAIVCLTRPVDGQGPIERLEWGQAEGNLYLVDIGAFDGFVAIASSKRNSNLVVVDVFEIATKTAFTQIRYFTHFKSIRAISVAARAHQLVVCIESHEEQWTLSHITFR